MRVAVIGAGAAGLAAARHATAPDSGVTCTVFEQSSDVGGTWVYTDRTGVDDFGLPIHSSIYKSLKTNLPTQVMCYPDFAFDVDEVCVPAKAVLDYLHKYKEHFDLAQYIKFNHHVRSVKSTNGAWEIKVVDLKQNEEKIYCFDAVMVCNGHYSKPNVPVLSGADIFRGELIHCHDYKTPDRFKDKRVVVVGAGHSARDIALEVSSVAAQVILSHHMKEPITNIDFPKSTLQKPDIESLSETAVKFSDGTSATVDVILYCTGYLYDFGFLDASCCIRVDNNFVQPLYKHLINIDLPSMCIVCLPTYVSPLAVADIQSQYFLKTLKGEVPLPSRAAMIADTEKEQKHRRSAPDFTNRKAHKMGQGLEQYCHEICDLAGIPRLPPVIFTRFNQSLCTQHLSYTPFSAGDESENDK